MVKDVYYGKTLRKSFVRHEEILQMPYLLEVQKTSGKMLKDFVAALPANEDIPVLAHDVAVFATSFPMPGFDTETMKIKTL